MNEISEGVRLSASLRQELGVKTKERNVRYNVKGLTNHLHNIFPPSKLQDQ